MYKELNYTECPPSLPTLSLRPFQCVFVTHRPGPTQVLGQHGSHVLCKALSPAVCTNTVCVVYAVGGTCNEFRLEWACRAMWPHWLSPWARGHHLSSQTNGFAHTWYALCFPSSSLCIFKTTSTNSPLHHFLVICRASLALITLVNAHILCARSKVQWVSLCT